jgi:methanogenic corrinoid protein MtbC1
MELGVSELFDSVLTPLLEQIGERWLRGTLSIAHEHLATALVRSLLDSMRASFSNPSAESTLVAATPAGEYHELGALKVAVLAAVDGWRSVFLGPNLPAAEITQAAAELKARVVALSLVHHEHDPEVESQLRRTIETLPKTSLLIVGGQAAANYRSLLSRSGTLMPATMTELRQELGRLA